MRNSIAVIAFVIGLLAVGMAAFQNNIVHAAPKTENAESRRTLKKVAADAAKKILEEKVLHKQQLPKPVSDPRRLPLHPYQLVNTGLGMLAIGLGVFGWTQKAHTRLAASAVGLGLIAIAWEWVLIAVGIAIIIFILSVLG